MNIWALLGKYPYLVIGFWCLMAIYFFFGHEIDLNYSYCLKAKDVREEKYQGIIVKKYIDRKNHGTLFIELSKDNNDLLVSLFIQDLYDNIVPGDSIFKPQNSFNFYLFNNRNVQVFRYRNGCDKFEEEWSE